MPTKTTDPAGELLIPVRRCARRSGALRLPPRLVLASPRSADVLPLTQLAADLRALRLRAVVARNAWGPAAVRIRRDPHVGGPEAYRLEITPEAVEIASAGDAGAYYAVQTLRDLVTVHGRTLPCCAIDDAPDFARRGVYHDCSRGKVPKLETLTALVEQLARWKINELQLYVENVFTFARHPAIGRGYSPFTPRELLDLQDHCARHHVRFVGSLASFGHMEKILALPRYAPLGEMPGFRNLAGGTTLCPTDPGSIRLVADLYEEFVPLFEARDFNVCCDETWELGRGRSKRRAARVGVGRLYLDFLLKIHDLCLRHGKRMNAWADIVLDHPELLAHLPKDAVMLNWDYNPRGRRIPRTHEITDAGLPLVVCPGTNAWNSHGCRLEMGMGNIARFAREGLARGAEGVLNTDWGDNGHRNMLAVSLHNFAYGAAASWCGRRTTAKGFTETFCRHTFGSGAGRLARAVRTLGGAHEALGVPDANRTPLYRTLIAPDRQVVPAGSGLGEALDAVAAADLAGHARALEALRWPPATRPASGVAAFAPKEYALAARLDAVACRRAVALKHIRAGRTPPAAELRTLIRDTRRLAADLERIWLVRNKPSRLRDQLSGLRRTIAHYRKLLRR